MHKFTNPIWTTIFAYQLIGNNDVSAQTYWPNMHTYFAFYKGFLSQTLSINTAAGRGNGPCFISLYHFHSFTNIQTLVSNFVYEMTTIFSRIASVYQTAIRWDLPPYWIKIWLSDNTFLVFVCLLDDLILSFYLLQQLNTGNKCIWTSINNLACIASKPTKQVH